MEKLKALLPFFFLLFAFSAAGCFGVDGDFKKVRNGVFNFLHPEDVDREFEYSVSNFEVYLVQKLASISDKTIDIELMLSKISNVQIGVYNLEKGEDNRTGQLKSITKYFKEIGWSDLVKSVDKNNCSMVFVNLDDDEAIRELFVINSDDEELVLVRVRGKLTQLAELMIKNRGTHKKFYAVN